MEHANTKLSAHSRLKMMRDYERGEPVAQIVREQAVSRTTFYRVLDRYRRMGRAGLSNGSCRPRSSPRRLPWCVEVAVLAYREREQVGPARIAFALGVPRSSVHRILCRFGRERLRLKTREPVYSIVHRRPGAQVGIDFKELASIGGGKPVFQLSAIDSFSRLAFARTVDRPLGRYAVAFLGEIVAHFQRRGVRVERVLTDNGLQFTMRHAYHRERVTGFDKTCRRLGIRHQLTRPYRPQTNGKVERFHRTVDEELYKKHIYQSNEERAQALRNWLVTYNTARPHLALKGVTPERACQVFLSAAGV
jgi:transposase InsO family protein